MSHAGPAQLHDDAVALGVVADAAHQLDVRARASEGQGHLHAEATGSQLAVGFGAIHPRPAEDDDHVRACPRGGACPGLLRVTSRGS